VSVSNWLDALQAGDSVIVACGGLSNPERSIVTVKRRTKTLIVIDRGLYEERFNARDGRQAVRRYHRTFLEEPTADRVAAVLDEMARRKYIALIERAKLKELSTHILAAAAHALTRGNAE